MCHFPTNRNTTSLTAYRDKHFLAYFAALNSPFSAADGAAIIAPSNSSARKRHVQRNAPDKRWAGIRPVLAHSKMVRCATRRYCAASRAFIQGELAVVGLIFEVAGKAGNGSQKPQNPAYYNDA